MVYAAPETQMVTDEYQFKYHDVAQYMASSAGVVVAYIDGRGSSGSGLERRAENYRRLGTLEVDDQIETTRQLVAARQFIDPSAVAIFGTSYGGYVALQALIRDHDFSPVFTCGIAVSPVTDWFYYDAVYSER